MEVFENEVEVIPYVEHGELLVLWQLHHEGLGNAVTITTGKPVPRSCSFQGAPNFVHHGLGTPCLIILGQLCARPFTLCGCDTVRGILLPSSFFSMLPVHSTRVTMLCLFNSRYNDV